MHEGNSEEEGQFDEGQEEEALQQKETEGGTSNPDKGEGEKDNDKRKEQTTEQDTQWTEMQISGSLDDVERDEQVMKAQNKETDSEEEETRMDNMEKDRGGRGQTRRRTLKVKPKVENARKKKMTRGRVKSVNI